MWESFRRVFEKRKVQSFALKAPDVVRCVEASDGRRRLLIHTSGQLFTWVVETFVEVDDGEWGQYEYWRPTEYSGLYDSPDDAEADARKSVPWLRNANEDQHNG